MQRAILTIAMFAFATLAFAQAQSPTDRLTAFFVNSVEFKENVIPAVVVPCPGSLAELEGQVGCFVKADTQTEIVRVVIDNIVWLYSDLEWATAWEAATIVGPFTRFLNVTSEPTGVFGIGIRQHPDGVLVIIRELTW
jgi:hypothetical protein